MARTLIFKIVASVIFLLSHAVYAAEMKMHHDTVIVDASKDRGSGISIFEDKLRLTTFTYPDYNPIQHIPILESCDSCTIKLVATNHNKTLAAVIVFGFVKDSLQKKCLVAYKAIGTCIINDQFDLNADKDMSYRYLCEQRQPDQIILYKELRVGHTEISFPTTSGSEINIKSVEKPGLIEFFTINFAS
jgi:hypothetical protein